MTEEPNLLDFFTKAYPREATPIIVTELITCDKCGTPVLKNVGYQKPEKQYAYEFYKPRGSDATVVQYSWGFYCPECSNWLAFSMPNRTKL